MTVIERWKCENHGEFDGHKTGPNGEPTCPYRGCTLPVERIEYIPAAGAASAVAAWLREQATGERAENPGSDQLELIADFIEREHPALRERSA